MKCLDFFYRLLARREYTAYELIKKAKEKDFNEEEINQALSDLQQKDYQSDIRFITNLITSCQGKYGKGVIKRKCLEKGISSDLFEEVWESENENKDDEEIENLDVLKAKVMRKYKINDFGNIEPKTKAKLWNYLQYRGFNPREILEQWQRAY